MIRGCACQESASQVRNAGRSRCVAHSSRSRAFARAALPFAVVAKLVRSGPAARSDLDAVLAAMKDVPKVMPERTAFYGMREFAVADPAGHFITFAQQAAAPKH